MPKFFKSNIQEKNKSKKRKKDKSKLVLKNLTFFSFAMVFGLVYLLQINILATQGYEVDSLKNKISELNASSRELELKSIELRSMNNLGIKVADLSMVEVENIDHINAENSSVAIR